MKNQSHFLKFLWRYADDLDLLDKMENYITRTCNNTTKYIDNKIAGKLSNKQLGELLRYYYQKHQELALPAMTLRLIDRGVISYFQEIFNGQQVGESISIFSASQRKTFATQERLALLELAVKISNGSIKINSSEHSKQLKKIHDSFFWSTLGYYNEPIKKLRNYRDEIDEMVKNDPVGVLKKINKHFSKEQAIRKLMIKNLSAKSKKVAKVGSEATYLKDYFKFSVNKITYHGEAIFKEIAKRSGCRIDTIKNLSHQDAINLISKKAKLDSKKINDYRRHTVFVSLTNKVHDRYIGQKADEYENKFLMPSKHVGHVFKGRTACRGLVKGYARIVHSPKDFNKVKKGEVIIVMNTGPDFVPLLSRVSAIVAEEGGITAHVSVISREMNIPCIVGIPRITKNIKNGSYVEVDAHKGIVKIL